ncbi:MAG: MATE family efflux transporter, partial [Clostridium butyricum]
MISLKTDLLKGSILKSLIIFAIPLLVSNIFQQLYNTMDTMIVGNFLGDTSLAAIGACTAVYDLLVGFALGIGNGLSIVTARSYGSNDETLLKKSVAGSIIIGILVTIIIMIISVLFLFPLLKFLNTHEEII